MSIEVEVLGSPGRDNALWVRIDSGQRMHRILFDCGAGCLDALSYSEILQTDELLFSHFHMDHVAGFDNFFRCNFNRAEGQVSVWGPPGTIDILHHRFRGYWWNLVEGSPGQWVVREVTDHAINSSTFFTRDSFTNIHASSSMERVGPIVRSDDFTIDAITLNHCGPTLGYVLREKSRVNISIVRLQELGLRPGPWMQMLKSDCEQPEVEVQGVLHSLPALRHQLLSETPGGSVAYLTDFRLDEATAERLTEWLRPCDTLVCEAQYCDRDAALAERNYHTTVNQVAKLAAASGVGRLTLFHLSDRYTADQWSEMLEEARSIFADTSYPPHWSDKVLIGP